MTGVGEAADSSFHSELEELRQNTSSYESQPRGVGELRDLRSEEFVVFEPNPTPFQLDFPASEGPLAGTTPEPNVSSNDDDAFFTFTPSRTVYHEPKGLGFVRYDKKRNSGRGGGTRPPKLPADPNTPVEEQPESPPSEVVEIVDIAPSSPTEHLTLTTSDVITVEVAANEISPFIPELEVGVGFFASAQLSAEQREVRVELLPLLNLSKLEASQTLTLSASTRYSLSVKLHIGFLNLPAGAYVIRAVSSVPTGENPSEILGSAMSTPFRVLKTDELTVVDPPTELPLSSTSLEVKVRFTAEPSLSDEQRDLVINLLHGSSYDYMGGIRISNLPPTQERLSSATLNIIKPLQPDTTYIVSVFSAPVGKEFFERLGWAKDTPLKTPARANARRLPDDEPVFRDELEIIDVPHQISGFKQTSFPVEIAFRPNTELSSHPREISVEILKVISSTAGEWFLVDKTSIPCVPSTPEHQVLSVHMPVKHNLSSTNKYILHMFSTVAVGDETIESGTADLPLIVSPSDRIRVVSPPEVLPFSGHVELDIEFQPSSTLSGENRVFTVNLLKDNDPDYDFVGGKRLVDLDAELVQTLSITVPIEYQMLSDTAYLISAFSTVGKGTYSDRLGEYRHHVKTRPIGRTSPGDLSPGPDRLSFVSVPSEIFVYTNEVPITLLLEIDQSSLARERAITVALSEEDDKLVFGSKTTHILPQESSSEITLRIPMGFHPRSNDRCVLTACSKQIGLRIQENLSVAETRPLAVAPAETLEFVTTPDYISPWAEQFSVEFEFLPEIELSSEPRDIVFHILTTDTFETVESGRIANVSPYAWQTYSATISILDGPLQTNTTYILSAFSTRTGQDFENKLGWASNEVFRTELQDGIAIQNAPTELPLSEENIHVTVAFKPEHRLSTKTRRLKAKLLTRAEQTVLAESLPTTVPHSNGDRSLQEIELDIPIDTPLPLYAEAYIMVYSTEHVLEDATETLLGRSDGWPVTVSTNPVCTSPRE